MIFAALSLFALLAGFDGLLEAQVEKVGIRTTGISCGVCAAVSEFQFRRLPGVEHVAVSLSNETITLTYKTDAFFDPYQIRQLLEPLRVGVVKFQVTAQGRVQKEGGIVFFVAGKNKFVLTPRDAASIPPGSAVLADGIVDDGTDPAQMRVSDFKPLKP